MTHKRQKVLILGSHPDSGFSMLNFTNAAFRAIRTIDGNFQFFFLKPNRVFGKFFPKKFPVKVSVYLDKFVVFGPFITVFILIKRIGAVHILDHSDSTYRFYIPKSCFLAVTVHDLYAIRAGLGQISGTQIGITGKFYQHLIKLGLSNSSLALPISKATENSLNELIPKLKTKVVHNFVYTNNSPKGKFNKNCENEKYFLILMNSHWRKDRATSIGVWKQLRFDALFSDFSLKIVGNPLTDEEIALIGEKELVKISIFNGLSNSEIQEIYSNCVAVINISKYEGFGMPIIEANFHRKICIYGGSDAFREIAGPENLEWSTSSKISSSKLLTMINSVEIGNRLFEYVQKNFTEENFKKKTLQVYKEFF